MILHKDCANCFMVIITVNNSHFSWYNLKLDYVEFYGTESERNLTYRGTAILTLPHKMLI